MKRLNQQNRSYFNSYQFCDQNHTTPTSDRSAVDTSSVIITTPRLSN